MSQSTRGLTLGEQALAKKTFRTSIDYSKVKVHNKKFMPLQPNDSGMTPNGEIYVAGLYRPDYSGAIQGLQGFFIHEMVHVYQYQLKILNPIQAAIAGSLKHGFNYTKAYEYTLDAKKDFLDYEIEEQAQIIEDYFRIYTLGLPPVPGFIQNEVADAKNKRLFHEVLAKFISDPNYARHNIECKRVNKNRKRRTVCRRVLAQ